MAENKPGCLATVVPPKTGTFTMAFLPKRPYLSCSVGGQSFYAPRQFNIKTIEAAGRAKPYDLVAANAAVGHYGTFDYQRSVDSAGSTTFYRGFTPVSNFDVGVYMQSAKFPQWATSLIANIFAAAKSSNAGDPAQGSYRNLGYNTAAAGQVPACVVHQ